MQITLSNQEVEAAVRAYVSERVVISPEAQVTLTEGTDGITASIDLGDETKPLGIVEKTTRRPRQPKEPKASEAAPAPLGDDETKKEVKGVNFCSCFVVFTPLHTKEAVFINFERGFASKK